MSLFDAGDTCDGCHRVNAPAGVPRSFLPSSVGCVCGQDNPPPSGSLALWYRRELEALRRPFDPAARGFHVMYRPGERNHCPGCEGESWYVGRATAECAFCGTALPLQEASHGGASATVVGWSTRPGVGPLA